MCELLDWNVIPCNLTSVPGRAVPTYLERPYFAVKLALSNVFAWIM